MRTSVLAVATLALLGRPALGEPPAGGDGGGDAVLFAEPFDAKLADGWTWLREDAGGWKIAEGALEIQAQAGTLWGQANNAKNVLLRKPPVKGVENDPFAVEATVTSAPAVTAEQAGVILYSDDDTNVKLVREHLEGKLYIVLAVEAGGSGKALAKKEVEGDTHALRLISQGGKIRGEVKTGTPAAWTPVGSGESPFKGEMQAGLVAHGGPADAARWAKFGEVRIVRPEVPK